MELLSVFVKVMQGRTLARSGVALRPRTGPLTSRRQPVVRADAGGLVLGAQHVPANGSGRAGIGWESG